MIYIYLYVPFVPSRLLDKKKLITCCCMSNGNDCMMTNTHTHSL